MIYWFFGLIIVLRFVTDYSGNTQLYFMCDSVMLSYISIYLYTQSKKTLANIGALVCILGLLTCQFIDNALWLIYPDSYFDYLPTAIKVFVIVDISIVAYEHRSKWKHVKQFLNFIKGLKE